MARGQNQKLKLLYILDILKRYSDEEHPLNASDICERLKAFSVEAERKSVYDDIARLGDYGADIIKVGGKNGGWFIGSREFEIPEIYLLCDAVRSANFISAKKTRELLAKLNGMLSVHEAKRRTGAVFFSEMQKSTNEEIYYNIDKLSRAISQGKQVRFSYSSRAFSSDRQIVKNTKVMTVSPYALTWQYDHYYVIGNYSKYDNLLHLRLDRISALEILETKIRPYSEVSEYTDFFDVEDYTNKLFGMYGGERCEIELRCDKGITEQVLDRFGENIFIKKVTDSEFSFSTKAAISDALVTWITNYADKLTVTRPEKLKEMVIERAKNILKYEEIQGEN